MRYILVALLWLGCSVRSSGIAVEREPTLPEGGFAGTSGATDAGAETGPDGAAAGGVGGGSGGVGGASVGAGGSGGQPLPDAGSGGTGASAGAGGAGGAAACELAEAFTSAALPTTLVVDSFAHEFDGQCVTCERTPCWTCELTWYPDFTAQATEGTVRIGVQMDCPFSVLSVGTCGAEGICGYRAGAQGVVLGVEPTADGYQVTGIDSLLLPGLESCNQPPGPLPQFTDSAIGLTMEAAFEAALNGAFFPCPSP